eukprot:GHVT01019251.1.p1 GENE.GHVT01019251.1~~GHVT01019251.1.p1  ORF type:complete len:629 (-),score=62.27 GHVT01019251.1:1071-2957(-)
MSATNLSSIRQRAELALAHLKPALPPATHPAALQKTPWNLNRYILLVVYIFYAFMSASVYFNWRNLSALLLRSGSYSWRCEGSSSTASENGSDYLCDAQDTAVQSLFAIAMACHFTMSAVAGTIIDSVGPRAAAIVGQLLNMTAWLLFGFCGESFNAYIPAAMCLGAGADMGFLPTLGITNLFPGATALTMTIMGSACSASFAIPLILDSIQLSAPSISFSTLCWAYMGIGPGLCLMIALLMFPWEGFRGSDRYSVSVPPSKGETQYMISIDRAATGLSTPQSVGCDSSGKTTVDGATQWPISPPSPNLKPMGASPLAVEFANLPAKHLPAAESEPSALHSTAHTDCENDHGPNAPPHKEHDKQSHKGCGRCTGFRLPKVTPVADASTSFLQQLCSIPFFGICVYFTVAGLAMTYYQEAAGRLYSSPSVEKSLEILVPLSFIPCILIGKLIDTVTIMPVLILVNTSGVLCYVFTVTGSVACEYASAVCFTVYLSVFTSQVYCFVEETFSSVHFGKLIGTASCFGGLLSLLSNVLYDDVTVRLLGGNPIPMAVAFIIILTLEFGLIGFVWIIKGRGHKKLIQKQLAVRNNQPDKQLPSQQCEPDSKRQTIAQSFKNKKINLASTFQRAN